MNQEKKPMSFKKNVNVIFLTLISITFFMIGFGVVNQYVWHDAVAARSIMFYSVSFLALTVGITSFWYVIQLQRVLEKHGLWTDELLTRKSN